MTNNSKKIMLRAVLTHFPVVAAVNEARAPPKVVEIPRSCC
jgi:hypothetical protein